MKNEPSEVYLLRRALRDACDHCGACGGDGIKALPGATMACDVCGPWRRLLKRTAPEVAENKETKGRRFIKAITDLLTE